MRGFTKMRGKDTCNLKGFLNVDLSHIFWPCLQLQDESCCPWQHHRWKVVDQRFYSAPCCWQPVFFFFERLQYAPIYFWPASFNVLIVQMIQTRACTNTNTHKSRHTQSRNMWMGLFLEADSLHFSTTIYGWKKEGRKRMRGGGNEPSDDWIFRKKSAKIHH